MLFKGDYTFSESFYHRLTHIVLAKPSNICENNPRKKPKKFHVHKWQVYFGFAFGHCMQGLQCTLNKSNFGRRY